METKVCSKCKEEKKLCEFHKRKDTKDGYRSDCKICRNLVTKKYIENNKEKLKESHKNWLLNNPDKRKKIQDKYNNKNERKIQRKEWAKNNRKKSYNYFNEKYNADPIFNLKIKFRRRIYMAIRYNNFKKTNRMINLLGCSYCELKTFIENKFLEGMNWELVMKGQIHLDHIVPLSSAKTEEELYKLCHYTNLQPLWAEENLKKSNKILN